MTFFDQNLLLQRLRTLFFGKGNAVSHAKTRERRFVVENLEERQLLSVTTVGRAEKLYEPAEPGYVAQNVSVDVIDTTSASLAAALMESENTVETLSSAENSPAVIDEQLSDDVGVSYSLDGASLTLEADIPSGETQPLRAGRVYGPMTYSEYLATLPLEPHDQNGGGMILMAGCGSPFLSAWSISLGGSSGACGSGTDSVYKTHDPNCHSVSDTYITLQSGNTATLYAAGAATYCNASSCYSVGVRVSGDEASTYFGTTYSTGTFTWKKPDNVTNKDAKRDFMFTYYVYAGSGSYTPNICDEYLGTLYVHIAYAEVQVQFAGEGDYKYRTAVGGVSTADNTVVAGQKVSAIVDCDPLLTVTNYQWQTPTDYVVKNYETNDDVGKITPLSDADYTSSLFEFYYANALTPFRDGGVYCNTTVSYQLNGQTKTQSVPLSSTYFIVAPTATLSATMVPTKTRIYTDGNSDEWVRLNSATKVGIEFEASITAPTIPGKATNNGGGKVYFVQTVQAYRESSGPNHPADKRSSDGDDVLDTTFPYYGAGHVNAGETLDSLETDDSPASLLYADLTYLKCDDHYTMYLMYKPDGTSIWIPIEKLGWTWTVTAERSSLIATWGLDSDTSASGYGSGALRPPVWTQNVKNLKWKTK